MDVWAGTVKLVGGGGQFLIDEPPDRLPVLDEEGHIAGPRTSSTARAAGLPVRALSEARIEKAGVMHAEFADRRIDRRHFGGEVGGDLHFLA